MTKDIYQEYALVKAKIKELEDQESAMRVQILEDMIAKGVSTNPTPLGKFTIAKLKRYEYPGYVTEAGEHYKMLKAQAESTGEAEVSEVDSLKFTAVKL